MEREPNKYNLIGKDFTFVKANSGIDIIKD